MSVKIEFDTTRELDLHVEASYTKGCPAHTPRGEYAPVDPPEPAGIEEITVMLYGHDITNWLSGGELESLREEALENLPDPEPEYNEDEFER